MSIRSFLKNLARGLTGPPPMLSGLEWDEWASAMRENLNRQDESLARLADAQPTSTKFLAAHPPFTAIPAGIIGTIETGYNSNPSGTHFEINPQNDPSPRCPRCHIARIGRYCSRCGMWMLKTPPPLPGYCDAWDDPSEKHGMLKVRRADIYELPWKTGAFVATPTIHWTKSA